MKQAIETRGLTKAFRRFKKEAGLGGSIRSLLHREYTTKTAVHAFDLQIAPGECVGLIGPNGAGKTTLVKMLTGIIAPSSGSVSVLGYTPNRLENAFKKRIAVVMGQKTQLIYDMTAADTFLLFKAMYDIPDDSYRRNLAMLTELFGARDYLNAQVRTLSLGERMKMELVTALLHDPEILFLDEPTIGLDAPAQRQIRAFLREVSRERGTTILLTSHYMDDVRSVCPRSVVIGEGNKLYDGDTEALFAAYQTERKVTLRFAGETAFAVPDGCTLMERSGDRVVCMVPRAGSTQVLAGIMQTYHPTDIAVEEEDMGLVVEKIYAGKNEVEA